MALEDIDGLSEKELNAQGHVDDHKKIVRGLKSVKSELGGRLAQSRIVTPTEFKKRRLSTTKTLALWKLYQSGHGFTATGGGMDASLTNMNDTIDVIRGSQSIKLVTTTAGGNVAASSNFTSVDISNASAIRLYMKYDVAVAGQGLDIYIGKSDFSAYFNKNTVIAGGGGAEGTNFPWQAGRWEVVDIPLSDFGVNGSANSATWANITRIQAQLSGPAGTACTVHIASIEAIQKDPFNAGPVAVITFDDTLLSQKTVCAPDLNSRGWPATFYPIIDQIQPLSQSSSNWDFVWMKSMYDTYGWEIGGHAYSAAAHGLGMPAMSVDQQITEIESVQSWQDANGFPAKTWAWPLGNHSRISENTVREYYTAAFTATRLLNETVSPPRRFAIQRYNLGYEPTANISPALTKVLADKGLIVFCVHDVTSGAGDSGSNATSPAKWAAFVTAMEAFVAGGGRVVTAENFLSNIR